MKFTIAELHENVMKSIEALKVKNSDNSRVSYTAKNALNILEESLKAFPMRFKNEETEVWVTDCPLAALQFKQHAGVKPKHPMSILAEAYRSDDTNNK